uniref:Uncharacterized protein n=1 Tax=viral metagenome TaxID=1070528 RepID=A0A6C0FCV4_9ZZZZ
MNVPELSESIKKMPNEVVNIIKSYCNADVQFVEIHTRYPQHVIYGYIMDICESYGDNIRTMLKIVSFYVTKIEPMFAIHPPFQFMRLPEVNCYRYWSIQEENTSRSYHIYKDVTILLDKIYKRIYSNDSSSCHVCRSSIYYYMRGLIMDIVRQHWSIKRKPRSYTI